jgi:hypothetical protein
MGKFEIVTLFIVGFLLLRSLLKDRSDGRDVLGRRREDEHRLRGSKEK